MSHHATRYCGRERQRAPSGSVDWPDIWTVLSTVLMTKEATCSSCALYRVSIGYNSIDLMFDITKNKDDLGKKRVHLNDAI